MRRWRGEGGDGFMERNCCVWDLAGRSSLLAISVESCLYHMEVPGSEEVEGAGYR